MAHKKQALSDDTLREAAVYIVQRLDHLISVVCVCVSHSCRPH